MGNAKAQYILQKIGNSLGQSAWFSEQISCKKKDDRKRNYRLKYLKESKGN